MKRYSKNRLPCDNRRRAIKSLYGITVEQYEQMRCEQKDLCAICSQSETRIIKGKICTLMIDHDHDTGKVRGLLCHKCNVGLGLFRNNIDFLTNAITYLKESGL